MINTAYKHLDSKLRIAALTVSQWVGIFAGVVLAIVYGDYVHPFGTMMTLVTAVYLGGLPIATILFAGFSDFNLMLLLCSAIRWRRMDGRYVPGPGPPTSGYRLHDATDWQTEAEGERLTELDLHRLWGER